MSKIARSLISGRHVKSQGIHSWTNARRNIKGETRQLSSICSSPWSSKKTEYENDYETQRSRQLRSFHSTARSEIVAPFIPEMVIFAVASCGWYVYRKSQGKPLTPDEALAAQEAFRKHEEQLRQRSQARYSNARGKREEIRE